MALKGASELRAGHGAPDPFTATPTPTPGQDNVKLEGAFQSTMLFPSPGDLITQVINENLLYSTMKSTQSVLVA